VPVEKKKKKEKENFVLIHRMINNLCHLSIKFIVKLEQPYLNHESKVPLHYCFSLNLDSDIQWHFIALVLSVTCM